MTQRTRKRTRAIKQVIPIQDTPAPEVAEVVSEPVVEVVETVEQPKLFSILQILKPEQDIPESDRPYFIAAKEGLFLHRKLLIGRGYVPQRSWPKDQLKSIGKANDGKFWWKAPIIPADICASIVSWFKHIYEKQHTEAEILLLMNHKTEEWKIWIPTQTVSHGGVRSVYEPEDIPADYVLVGSMHSHCDFGAFHSGVDTGDAQTFDGVHLTIGHIMDEQPEVVAMVMMNKVRFNYETVAMLADFTDLSAGEFDSAWDEYVETSDKQEPRAKNYELFEKYQPPTRAITTYKPPTTWTPNVWSNQPKYIPGVTPPSQPPSYYNNYQGSDTSGWDDDWDMWREFWKDRDAKSAQESLWEKNQREADSHTQDIIRRFDADYWEDALPDGITDSIIDSITLQEKDIDHVMANFTDGMSVIWWRTLYLKKLADCHNVLNSLGMEVNYQVRPKKYTREEGK